MSRTVAPTTAHGIFDVVWGSVRLVPRRHLVVGAIVGLALHAALVALAQGVEPNLAGWASDVAHHIRDQLRSQQSIDLPKPKPQPVAPPKPPEPAPIAAPPQPVAALPKPPTAAPRKATVTTRPALGRPDAVAPGPPGPVDFTATSYTAGPGALDGDPNGGGPPPAPDPKPPHPPIAPSPPVAPPPDHSRRLALADRDWSCPWPAAADDASIDRQAVLLHVAVGADGRALTARALKDPGFGFGGAAVSCALHARYTPARDRGGQVIRAEASLEVDFFR